MSIIIISGDFEKWTICPRHQGCGLDISMFVKSRHFHLHLDFRDLKQQTKSSDRIKNQKFHVAKILHLCPCFLGDSCLELRTTFDQVMRSFKSAVLWPMAFDVLKLEREFQDILVRPSAYQFLSYFYFFVPVCAKSTIILC